MNGGFTEFVDRELTKPVERPFFIRKGWSQVKLAIGIAFSCAACALPAAANDAQPKEGDRKDKTVTLDCKFDLAAPDRVDPDRVMQDEPALPRGTDTRAIAWNAPVVIVPLAKDGPVLSAGALGKPRKGVPGLAHVAIGWDF